MELEEIRNACKALIESGIPSMRRSSDVPKLDFAKVIELTVKLEKLQRAIELHWVEVGPSNDLRTTVSYACSFCHGIVWTRNLPTDNSYADALDAVPHEVGCVVPLVHKKQAQEAEK